jgi:hypothetical protein
MMKMKAAEQPTVNSFSEDDEDVKDFPGRTLKVRKNYM